MSYWIYGNEYGGYGGGYRRYPSYGGGYGGYGGGYGSGYGGYGGYFNGYGGGYGGGGGGNYAGAPQGSMYPNRRSAMDISGGMNMGESMMDRLRWQGSMPWGGGGGGGGGGGQSNLRSMDTDYLNNIYGPPGGY